MIMAVTYTHLESVWNPSGPSEVPYLLLKLVTSQELFFVVSYIKPALVHTSQKQKNPPMPLKTKPQPRE